MKNVNKVLAITGIVAVLAITNVASSALANTGEGVNEGDAPQMQQMHKQMDPEKMEEMKQHREEVKAAVESGDYDAWYALMSEHERAGDILEKINADNFYLLEDMHQAIQDGDREGAKAIADELGIKKPMKHRGKMGKNFDPEKAEEMKAHMEAVKGFVDSGDYQGWVNYLAEEGKDPKILETINADNFHLLGELHEAKENGDREGAKAIADELGFERPMKGKFKGRVGGQRGPAQQ
ncbi:hypothetical protein ACFL3C_04310 [Patescibacteria group bacterium]